MADSKELDSNTIYTADDIHDRLVQLKTHTKVIFQKNDPLLENQDPISNQLYINIKNQQDRAFQKLPRYLEVKLEASKSSKKLKKSSVLSKLMDEQAAKLLELDEEILSLGDQLTIENRAVVPEKLVDNEPETQLIKSEAVKHDNGTALPSFIRSTGSRSLQLFQQQQESKIKLTKPEWHAPWKLMRVVAGHSGWVRSLTVEPQNQWYASGAADSTIKVWDLASSTLKLTLTGHIMPVRGLVVSSRHPYMFSCSEDKTIKCWDLEKNKVIRDYHGHLSSVYCIDIHPTLDLIATGGRDSSVRLWDIRTRVPVHVLTGHDSFVTNVKCQATSPQLISTSMDSTVRTWDIVAGKTRQVLTHHRKAVRALAVHEVENSFATGSSDNIKQWKLPDCNFLQNFSPRHELIVNTLSVNQTNVMFSGADDGSMSFFDWKSGQRFQLTQTVKMPGSLDSENGIYCSTFDRSGSRLITGELDKSIKVWKEDENAVEPDV